MKDTAFARSILASCLLVAVASAAGPRPASHADESQKAFLSPAEGASPLVQLRGATLPDVADAAVREATALSDDWLPLPRNLLPGTKAVRGSGMALWGALGSDHFWLPGGFRATAPSEHTMLSTAPSEHTMLTAGRVQQQPQELPSREPDVQVDATQPRQQERQPSMAESASYLLIWCVFATCVAFFYISNRRPPEFLEERYKDDDLMDWRNGLFSCFDDMDTCVWSCFCPCIRWAETLSYVPGLNRAFWTTFFLYLICWFLSRLPNIELFGWCLLGLLGAWHRQEIRKTFRFRDQSNFAIDCLTFCFCTCCAISQEARHVEDAMKWSRNRDVARPVQFWEDDPLPQEQGYRLGG